MAESHMNVDAKLALDHFTPDEGHAHIVVRDEVDQAIFDQLIRCCPAGLYGRNSAGEPTFHHVGCLECGTCRILGGGTVLERWAFPASSMGIEYRY